jgi:TRAP-type C4-dicarboxylate transport system substrate-binding protein
MLALSRRGFLRRTAATSAGMASFAILTRRSDAAEFSWRYANNVVVAHPVNVQLAKAVDKIREESSGRIEIQIFPNNQLGGDTAMLSQLRAGAIEMFNLSGLILATFVPIASINGIGFAFKDYQQVWTAVDGPLGVYVRGAIEKSSLTRCGITATGRSQVVPTRSTALRI